MAEKIKILELDLNADEMLETIKQLKTRIEELKQKQKEAKESGGELSDEYIILSGELKTTQEELRTTENVFRKLMNAHKDTVGTIMKLEAENAKLRQEQKLLNLETEEGRKRNEEINKKLNENNRIIFENSDKLKQNKMSVGGYVDAMKEMGFGLRDVSKSFGIAGVGVDNLNLKMLRFLMSPIGLLIGAIVGAFYALGNTLSSFKPYMDKVEQGAAALASVFAFLKDRIIGLITGAMSLKDFFKGLVGGMKETANAAMELKKAQQNIDDEWDKLSVKEKKIQNQIDELMLKSKNRTISEKERIKILKEAQKLEEQLHERRLELAKEDYENQIKNIANKHKLSKEEVDNLRKYGIEYLYELQDKVKGGKTISDAEIEDLKKREEKLLDIENESIKIREKIQNKLDENYEKARQAAEKRRQEEEQKRQKEEQEQQKQAEEEAKRRKEAAEAAVNDMLYKLRLWREANKSKIQEGRYFTEQDIQNEFERLDTERKLEEQIKKQQYKTGLITENDYRNALLDIEEKYQQAKEQIQIEYAIQEAQRIEIDAQNKLQLFEEGSAAFFEAQKAELERQRQLEIAAAERTGADVVLINKKYNKYELQLEQQKNAAKLELAASIANNVANLFGKATYAGKLAASAQVAVDTIKGAQSAYAAAQVIPPPAGQIIGAANAALVIAAGAKSVSDIWSVKSGLPETSGGMAGNQLSNASFSSSGTAAGEAEKINQNVAGQIGAGMIARNIETSNNMTIAEQLARINVQPVLVIDDVIRKQNEVYNKNYTQIL